MNYFAIKGLKAPRLVRETLAAYGTALVANNGKPMAMLVDLAEGENPDRLSAAVGAAFRMTSGTVQFSARTALAAARWTGDVERLIADHI